MEASASVTQVLFFKAKAQKARLRHVAGTLGVAEDSLTPVADAIAQKVTEYTEGYVKLPRAGGAEVRGRAWAARPRG